MSKALFLDLDGTIIETKSGETFPTDVNDWKFKKGILNKIKEYVDDNYKIIIVTNQAGIDEGYIKPLDFLSKMEIVLRNIDIYCKNKSNGDYYISQFLKCPNRKPSPNFAFQAKKEYGLDLSQCIMVGDASGLERETLVKENVAKILEQFQEGQRGLKDVVVLNNKIYILRPAKENEESNLKINSRFLGAVSMHEDIKYRLVLINKDHSDSDKMFAENAGMKYIDIEEFLKD